MIAGSGLFGKEGAISLLTLIPALACSIMIGVSWAAFGYIVRSQATIVRLLAQIADKNKIYVKIRGMNQNIFPPILGLFVKIGGWNIERSN